MERVLVSACLLGRTVRYDGGHKQSPSDVLGRWLAQGRVVAVCPEVAGGLPVPRPPAEITSGHGGDAVWSGAARVLGADRQDFTPAFVAGARHALAQAEAEGIRVAVLKNGRPSCGSSVIRDGSFTGRAIAGRGVTAELLASAGIQVFSEDRFEDADRLLLELERRA
jgi:uncharacterized protein YbbK (DUF523 family)